MVNVAEKGGVTVKAIDNDACFGNFIVGPGKFLLRGEHAFGFVQHLAQVRRNLYPLAASGAQSRRINGDPGIRRLQDGSILVDTSKMTSPEIHYCLQQATGCHVTRAPDYIDEELYDKLVAMKGGKAREDYLADLRARLTADQVQAATTRLDAAIAHAEKLREARRVVSTEDWGKKDVQRMVAGGKSKGLQQVGGQSPKDTEFARKVKTAVADHDVPLFRRDLLACIAKPGWFED